MIFKKARNPAYADDDPRIVLVLRWATEPQPGRSIPFLISCGFGALICILTVGALDLSPEEMNPHRQVTQLFVPAPRIVEHPRPSAATRSIASNALRPELAPVVLPPIKARVDMSSIRISVRNGDELPEVVRQQGGVLALVERNDQDQSMARYTFKPPDWRMSDQYEDMSGRIRFSMTPASKWALLRSLADSHSIAIENYQVDALFDSAYALCLEREIRKQADLSHNPGRVRAAVLVFTSSRSCGIDVVNLEFAGR